MNNYTKLILMITVSFAVMYSVMFLNVYDFDHIYLSFSRIYMTILMVSPMAVMMILLMPEMFKNKKLNFATIILSILIFTITLVFLRNQTLISDEQYMKAMIPHHSSAILTSKNAYLTDPEVKNFLNR